MQPRHRDRYDFYNAQNVRFGSSLAAEVRRDAYGEDFGQQGWWSLDEQNEIASLIREQSAVHLLDVACGSGGPSLAIAVETGCRLTGVDIDAVGVENAKQHALARALVAASSSLLPIAIVACPLAKRCLTR